MKDIIISGQDLELTDSLKKSVETKMSKLFTLDDRIIRVKIDLAYKPNK